MVVVVAVVDMADRTGTGGIYLRTLQRTSRELLRTEIVGNLVLCAVPRVRPPRTDAALELEYRHVAQCYYNAVERVLHLGNAL